jgi:hypothetical protein
MDATGQAVILNAAGNGYRVLYVNSGIALSLNSLTVANGGVCCDQLGGGIYTRTLIITNSTLSGNEAYHGDGGAIYNGGTLTNQHLLRQRFDGGHSTAVHGEWNGVNRDAWMQKRYGLSGFSVIRQRKISYAEYRR